MGKQTPRTEALRRYTEGSAWFSFDDHQVGSITEGKYADLSVLSADYLTVPDNAIGGSKLHCTLVAAVSCMPPRHSRHCCADYRAPT